MDSPQPTTRELLNELITRLERVEENQAALEGAIQAFITVFAVRRFPTDLGNGMSIDDFAARLSHTPVPWWLARAASWALAGYALVTGIDYLNTPTAIGRSLTMVEKLQPLQTWGVWYILAGGLLAFGLMIGRHVMVWLGHLLCAGLYGAFAAATLQAVIEFQRSPQASAGWIWRAAYVSLMIFAGHVSLCWLRGPIPRRGDEA